VTLPPAGGAARTGRADAGRRSGGPRRL